MSARGSGDEGQAAVEFALVLPLVFVLVLALIQVGLVVHQQVLVVHAAREAARQLAVDPSTDAAADAAARGSGLDRSRLKLRVHGREGPGSRVEVDVRYRAPTDVPIVGAVVADLVLTSQAAMRVED